MKNLKFGVDRANIEDDTAIYTPYSQMADTREKTGA